MRLQWLTTGGFYHLDFINKKRFLLTIVNEVYYSKQFSAFVNYSKLGEEK